MCLVTFALDAHPRHSVVLAGNRDEAHSRPAAPLSRWADAPDIVAGRDLSAGGTWLGVTASRRWAVLTNVRDPRHPRAAIRSRGALVADYLQSDAHPRDFAAAVQATRDDYDGFNLVVGLDARAYAVSTRHDVKRLGPGVYGLSNDQIDTGWPKVSRARTGLREAIQRDPVRFDDLFDLLDDRRPAAYDWMLPDTGVGIELERILSPIRIVTDGYGTRVSTVLTMTTDGPIRMAERTWHPDGTAGDLVQVEL